MTLCCPATRSCQSPSTSLTPRSCLPTQQVWLFQAVNYEGASAPLVGGQVSSPGFLPAVHMIPADWVAPGTNPFSLQAYVPWGFETVSHYGASCELLKLWGYSCVPHFGSIYGLFRVSQAPSYKPGIIQERIYPKFPFNTHHSIQTLTFATP